MTKSLDEVVLLNEQERTEFETNIKDYENVIAELEEELIKCNEQLTQNEEEKHEYVTQIVSLEENTSSTVKTLEQHMMDLKDEIVFTEKQL